MTEIMGMEWKAVQSALPAHSVTLVTSGSCIGESLARQIYSLIELSQVITSENEYQTLHRETEPFYCVCEA